MSDLKKSLVSSSKKFEIMQIPEMPKVLIELERELSSPLCSSQVVSGIIKSNTVISGEVIQIVNRLFKDKANAKTIEEAIMVCGLENIKTHVVSASLSSGLSMFSENKKLQEIVDIAVETAFLCSEISDEVQGVSRSEAFTFGLFMNAGELILSANYKDYFDLYFKGLSDPAGALALERKRGACHPSIGYLTGLKWGLDQEILHSILLSHEPLNKIKNYRVKTFVSIGVIASYLASEVVFDSYMSESFKGSFKEAQEELMLKEAFLSDLRRNYIVASMKSVL